MMERTGNQPDARGVELTDEQIVAALLNAYRQGLFPMGDTETGEVRFYRPDVRGVVPLLEDPGVPRHGAPQRADQHRAAPAFHVPRTVEKLIRQGRFELRIDTAFDEVVRACAAPRAPSTEDHEGTCEPGTWINDTIIDWYTLLHRHGHAHSVEAWAAAYNNQGQRETRLVGGVYGVAIGAAFFGESMFHIPQPRRPDGTRDPFDGTGAGQVCLVALVRRLRALGFTLFDAQMTTAATRRFGAYEVPLIEYLKQLGPAVNAGERWRATSAADEPRA